MVKTSKREKCKVDVLKLNVPVSAFNELGKVTFSAFRKTASSEEIREAIGWRGFNQKYFPAEIIVQLSVGPNKNYRVERIIDNSSENSPFETDNFLHILSCRHKKLNYILKSETKLDKWFSGSGFDPRSKGETDLKRIIKNGFERTRARLAELPVRVNLNDDEREVLCKWHVTVPFTLDFSQSAYVPDLSDIVASGDIRKEEDILILGEDINAAVAFA